MNLCQFFVENSSTWYIIITATIFKSTFFKNKCAIIIKFEEWKRERERDTLKPLFLSYYTKLDIFLYVMRLWENVFKALFEEKGKKKDFGTKSVSFVFLKKNPYGKEQKILYYMYKYISSGIDKESMCNFS